MLFIIIERSKFSYLQEHEIQNIKQEEGNN